MTLLASLSLMCFALAFVGFLFDQCRHVGGGWINDLADVGEVMLVIFFPLGTLLALAHFFSQTS